MSEIKKVSEKRVIKFNDDEMTRIEKFKNDFSQITARLGEVEIELTLLDSQTKIIQDTKDKLKQEYIQLRESEVKLASELREKYGEGEFDINTGVFTPKK
jgi:predicted nuclease with TOPRIM domain